VSQRAYSEEFLRGLATGMEVMLGSLEAHAAIEDAIPEALKYPAGVVEAAAFRVFVATWRAGSILAGGQQPDAHLVAKFSAIWAQHIAEFDQDAAAISACMPRPEDLP